MVKASFPGDFVVQRAPRVIVSLPPPPIFSIFCGGMQAVFWHSSAHCLGLAMEKKYGCHLTHGPPVDNGFFYDCFMGGW